MNKKKIVLIVAIILAILVRVICSIIFSDALEGDEDDNYYYQSYKNNILGIAGDFCVFTYGDAIVSEVTADVAVGGDFTGQSIANYETRWDNFYKTYNLRHVNLNSYVRGKYNSGKYAWSAKRTQSELTTSSGELKGTYDVFNADGETNEYGKANLYIYTGDGNNVITPSNPNQSTINGNSYDNPTHSEYSNNTTGDQYQSYNVIGVDYEFIDFETVFSRLETISETLMFWDSQIQVDCLPESGKTYTYNFPEDKDTVLITVDPAVFFDGTICDTFNINGLDSTKKIIINVNCEGYLDKSSPKIQVNGSADDWNILAENIIFNYYLEEFVDESIEAKEVIGTILAPNMNVYINGNLDGSVITRNFSAGNNAIYGINSNISWSDIQTTPEKETITISGSKIWEDNNNENNTRPESITLTLYKKGVDGAEDIKVDGITNPITVTAADSNEWTFSFEEVDKYDDDGNEIEYIVKEEQVEGYTTSVEGYIITNTYEQQDEVTSVKVTKEWKDNNNQNGKRPISITVRLLANGQEIKSQEITADDNWTYEFTDLPTKENNETIEYTITEDKIENYITTIDGYNIINTYLEEVITETVNVTITKVWKDEGYESSRPEKVTINLFADGTKIKSQELTATDNWKYTFSDLDKYDSDNKEINYTVTEDSVSGYKTEISGYTITNTYIPPVVEEKLNLTIEKYETNTTKKLEGAKLQIKLQNSNSKTIANKTETTNSNGQIIIEDIEVPEGEYTLTIKEQTAPEGYEKADDTIIKFTVKKQNDSKTIEFKENYTNASANNFSITVKIEDDKTPEEVIVPGNNTTITNNTVDNSITNNIIPQTGDSEKIIKITIIAGVLIVAAYCIYNYKKLKF